MSLRSVRAVAGRATALLVAGFVVVILSVVVIVPKLAGGTAYTILTGSMRPALPPGTLVVARPVKPSELRAGDVITFQIKSGDPTIATHRVKAVGVTLDGQYRFTTQGDANNAPDPQVVQPAQIRGVLWYAVPVVGYPALVVDSNARHGIVIGAVLVLFGYAAASFFGAFRDRRRREPESVDGPVDRDTMVVSR